MSVIDTPASEEPDRQWDKSQTPCRIYPIAIAGSENNLHRAKTSKTHTTINQVNQTELKCLKKTAKSRKKAAITTRNEVQNICSHRPWKSRRKIRILPSAPSKPTTKYNRAMRLSEPSSSFRRPRH